jgi:hypothetical protein
MPKHPFEENFKAVARELEAQYRALTDKLAQGKAEQTQVEAELEAIKTAQRQMSTFPQEYARERICFDCWLKQIRSPLVPIGGGTDTEDYFKCPTCKRETAERFV